MNALERFWSLFSRNRIAKLEYENKLLREENQWLKAKDQEHYAEVAYVAKQKDAYWQSKFDAFKSEVSSDLASISDTLAQFKCKEASDEPAEKDC
jgi:hypothetical protein